MDEFADGLGRDELSGRLSQAAERHLGQFPNMLIIKFVFAVLFLDLDWF